MLNRKNASFRFNKPSLPCNTAYRLKFNKKFQKLQTKYLCETSAQKCKKQKH